MERKTIYAMQINPEYQESPLSMDNFDIESAYPGIAVFGNRDYKDHIPENIERVMDVLNDGELADILDSFNRRLKDYNTEVYKNVSEAIADFLQPEHKARYSTREIHDLNNLVCSYGVYSPGEDAILLSVLNIVTGKKYQLSTIRGCCQGEWQSVLYPSDVYSDETIEYLEKDYFNTGSEWIIHDEESIPESAEDISGYSVYCYSWNLDGIADEIMNAVGADDSYDIVLYGYEDGYYERLSECAQDAESNAA